MLAILLSVALVRPPMPLEAAELALGSLSTSGSVTIGAVAAPSETAVFPGDLVRTGLGSAVVQYRQGARVLLGMDSAAQFTAEAVRLEKGQMTFRSGADGGLVFSASTLRLEPASAGASANVILNDGRASIAVTSGAIRVVDPSGLRLADLNEGEARLFSMASASAIPVPPAPPAAVPQAGSGSKKAVWLLSLGGAAAATAIILAKTAFDDDRGEIAEAAAPVQSQAAAAQTSLNNSNTQLTALSSQAAALRAQVPPNSAAGQQLASIAQQIEAAQQQQSQLQGQLNSVVQQLNQAVAAGNQSAISSLSSQLQALQNQIAALQTTINNLASQLGSIQIPPVSP